MHTHKIALFLAAAALVSACNFIGGSEQTQIDDLKAELAEMKESKNALQQSYIKQNAEISRILDELAEISGRTASLRTDVESGYADIEQAEQISTSIDNIRRKISSLEKSYADVLAKNREFEKMIKGFQNVISEQENQISVLKQEIETRDQTIALQNITIKEHESTIAEQDETIQQKNEELQLTVEKQARMLFEAGALLEDVADNAPEVSWKRNKEKMDMMTQDIYRKALVYYQQAYEAGYEPARSAIASLQAKIQAQ